MQSFSFFFFLFVMGGGGDFGSGSGSKFNCAARVGSGQTISGTGRVRASVLSPCRPLGGSLERGCLAHREIAGYRLLHRGHPFIAIFTHPLNVSITSMLKPMNTRKNGFFHSFSTSTWRFRKKGRLARAGCLWPEILIFMIHNLQ